VLAALHFLTPQGALVALAAVAPLLALAVARRRSARVAAALGLLPETRPPLLRTVVLVAICGSFGVAAAQPALDRTPAARERRDAQAFFVLDVSRSMLASPGPAGPTRLERARRIAERLRARIPELPAGLAGLTDRLLPYAFPTVDARVFASTLADSVRIEAPPPQQVRSVASTFDALRRLAGGGYFAPAARTRLCVLLTDGESRPFAGGALAASVGSARGCRLLVVRVGGAGERVYGADGTPEPEYRPDAAAASQVDALARAVGGAAFLEEDVGAAGAALTRFAGRGPTSSVGRVGQRTSLAVYPALLGAALVLLLLVPRLRQPVRRA
jgi:hypothetical protein